MASTNISLNDEAYQALKKLKRPGQSFSDVVIEHLRPPAATCGELLDLLERVPAPAFDAERMETGLKNRKRRINHDC